MSEKNDKSQKKETLKDIWLLKDLTLRDFIKTVKENEGLKWVLGFGGLWFVMKNMLGILIGYHVVKLVIRIFMMVLS